MTIEVGRAREDQGDRQKKPMVAHDEATADAGPAVVIADAVKPADKPKRTVRAKPKSGEPGKKEASDQGGGE